MFTKSLRLFSPIREGDFSEKLHLSLPYLVILTISFFTFVSQSNKVGFEARHQGWGSSQSLAIISKATLANGFVGHTVSLKDREGKKDYYYFDRYPIFFSAFVNLLLSLSDNLATKVYLARQIMNFIFLSTLMMAFILINKLIGDSYLALAAVLMSFSNYLLLFHKDMIYFDPPALFGFIFLLYAIAVYKLDGKKRLLYIAAFVAIALGRGYASYAIMTIWVVMECFIIIKSSKSHPGDIFTRILKHPSFVILVIGVIWGTTLLAYNIHIEAQTRGVSYIKTSIIESALRRLSFNEKFNEQHSDALNWKNFTIDQAKIIIDLSIPQGHEQLGAFKYLILLPMAIFIPRLINREKSEQRLILLLIMLSGLAWLFAMRNLTAFHYHTLIYYIGIPLVFYTAIFSTIKFLRQYKLFLLLFCLALYLASVSLINLRHSKTAEQVNEYTYDFDRIRQAIAGPGKNIYFQAGYKNVVPGAPYAPGFYLAEHYITPLELSDYVISTNKSYSPTTLTPFNKKVFLFEK